ncbi:MAG TPA: hypothetical protein VGS41_08460 [Chthonomonadales bacterium]|nr:hypothetical protein [Chthonomonadales bacterium]
MQQWRYKVVVIRELALSEAKLNSEGEKGWELVAVGMSDSNTARAFFKQRWEDAPDEHHETHGEDHARAVHAVASPEGPTGFHLGLREPAKTPAE